MATDTINVVSVTPAGGVTEIGYTILTDAPIAGKCVWYEALAKVEVWAHTTNNRALATKIGDAYVTALGTQFKITGLAANSTRYAWFRAISASDNVGDWFPSSATGGIAATTSNQVPPPGSVTPVQTSGNFPTLAALSADFGNITAGNVTGVTFTGGVFRTAISGQRVEITGADNFLRIYNSVDNVIASFGENSLLGTNTVLSIQRNISAHNIIVTNSIGNAIWAQGAVEISGTGSRPAFTVSGSGGTLGVAIKARSDASGGEARIAVPNGSGGWAVYADHGAYGPFTGAHPGLLPVEDESEPGDILVDVGVEIRHGIDDTLTEVARSSNIAQRNVIGVLSTRRPFPKEGLSNLPKLSRYRRDWYRKHHDLVTVNAVGEGQVNICGQGGDLEPGDFICTSDMPGKGMRQSATDGQADDFLRRCTVARVRERVRFKSRGEVKLVACVYLCG